MGGREFREIDLSDRGGRAIFALGFCLMVAVNYLDVPIHEIGHGLAAVALGGGFYGFDLGPFGGQAYFGGVEGMADRALVATGGILAQYLVGLVCLVLLSRIGKTGFVLRSALLWMALGNLADPSLSILTVSRDARKIIYHVVLVTGAVQAFTLIRIFGLTVCLASVCVPAANLKAFLLKWFPWTRSRTAWAVSFLICSVFVVGLGLFRLLSTWGVQLPYALLFDLLVACDTTLLAVMLRGGPESAPYRSFSVRSLIPAAVAFIVLHLLLLVPHPLFVPMPTL